MKFDAFTRRILWLFLCVFCGSGLHCLALDREAFSITAYDLNAQIDPSQQRLGVRGKITLRNDSQSPQKIAVLQITSSLSWRSIRVGDKSLQFVMQPYTSDIDHTGSLSEAIVTLPQPIAPKGSIEFEIAYEGVIVLDATRLTRIGTPEDAARSTDWDQISADFSALRGAGYVTWYPIATEAANLSEDDNLFEVLGRWKLRETGSKMHLGVEFVPKFEFGPNSEHSLPDILFNGVRCNISYSDAHRINADCQQQTLRLDAPTLIFADYQVLEHPSVEIHFLRGHDAAAANFAKTAKQIVPFITDWLGPQRERAEVADLPDPDAAPFESGSLLLTALANQDSKLAGLTASHQLTHAAFFSFRPWIEEGLAHFAQALYLEQQKNRQAALDYMGLHRSAFMQLEKPSTADDEVSRSLVNTTSEELYRSKAMCVWWMLRDLIGDAALKKAIAAYRPEQDKEPSYMPRLIAAQTQRDLEWFFDDWVYRDRGLPDFKVESAFPRRTLTDSYMVTVTVDNLGTAGAEVPVIVKFSHGEVVKRLEVRAKSKVTIRVETPSAPEEIIVNDGSVPESDMSNNIFKIDEAAK